jgi:hypothetical protein
VRAPLVETQQDGSIRVADLTPVVMARSRFGLPKKRLVPFEAERNVSDADYCPCALHCVLAASLTHYEQTRADSLIRDALKSNPAFACSRCRSIGVSALRAAITDRPIHCKSTEKSASNPVGFRNRRRATVAGGATLICGDVELGGRFVAYIQPPMYVKARSGIESKHTIERPARADPDASG